MKLLKTLEILDMTLVTLLVSEDGLTVDRGVARYITLTINLKVDLRKIL